LGRDEQLATDYDAEDVASSSRKKERSMRKRELELECRRLEGLVEEIAEELRSTRPAPPTGSAVPIDNGIWVGGKFLCTGNYGSFPWNPFAEDWPEFDVNFNGDWVTVRVVEHEEYWGWKAQDVNSLRRAELSSPKIEIRH
jgi:hypothetical protein